MLALAGGAGAPAAAAPPVPIEPYGRLPTIEMVALSMDGTKLATIQSVGNDRVLAVTSIDDGRILGGIHLQDIKTRDLRWGDNRHVLVVWAASDTPIEFSAKRSEIHLIQSFDTETKELRPLLKHIATYLATTDTFFGRPSVVRDDKDPAVVLRTGLGVYAGLVRVNLNSGDETVVLTGEPHIADWILNDRGEPVAEEDYNNDSRRWTIKLLDGKRTVQSVTGIAPIDMPEMRGLSADGDALIVAMPGDEQLTLKQLQFKDGSWGEDLAPVKSTGSKTAVTEIIHEVASDRMMGYVSSGDVLRYRFTAPEVQQRWDWVERAFWNQRVEYVGSSADHNRFIVRVLGPRAGYAYYLADADEHLTKLIGKIYAGVDQIAEVRTVTYPAADGLEIPAYLTLPPGRPAKNLPVIILPHGGPQARDHYGFDWWAQGLASQGYAVLQPQFRGSDLGRSWVEKGYGEWGRKMQSDVSDGLRYLVKEGIADPQRACIVGASYGGYAALAGATLEAGTYRCAIAVAGVSDPANMLRWVRSNMRGGDSLVQRYWDRFMGANDTSDKRLDEISPLKHVDRVQGPVLLIHGREDSTVPYEQSADIEKALKRAGKTVEFVTLKREDHYMSHSDTRLLMMTAQVEFLRKYNPPD
jgi:dipeptidyl aminopeptidase/acylaminoacyl peptidase